MKKSNKKTFFDLPAREKKKVIKIAIKGANKDQRDLIEKSKIAVKKMQLVTCH